MQFFRNLPYNRLVVVTNDEGNEVHYRIAHAWHYYDNGVSHSQEFKNYLIYGNEIIWMKHADIIQTSLGNMACKFKCY